MNLEELRRKYLENGFSFANASAKICQDIILNKISKSKMNKNVTIKGGVVMYGLSNDKRRATRDLDLDFIKYSLADESIKKFIDILNLVDDGIEVYINGEIQELHHQDYKGKRVNVILKDKNNFNVSAKLDIGVYKNFDIRQEEYCFNLEAINESATLVINSKEQIICEKLKSLLRFGIRTTRYKDIFDIYYLINKTSINKDELLYMMNKVIIEDSTMRENNIKDIIKNLNTILNNNIFKRSLSDARNNWLEISADQVINNIINYFKSMETFQV
jgi:predicted nucleotidyltransferase component of viral defense system